jgi:3-methyladenine DNA glycosylase AlkD
MTDEDFDPAEAARAVTAALRSLGTPERAAQEKRYLKSDLEFLGVTVPDMRRMVKAAARRYPGLDGVAAVAWATALWRDPVHERRMAAVEVLTLAARHPAAWPLIDAWASDADFWIRRSALLALLPGIRVSEPDLTRFVSYAEPMLAEREFFIRKAIGWVLREISRRDPEWTAEWTRLHISGMSGVTFREAVRRLPAQEAERLRGLRLAGGR